MAKIKVLRDYVIPFTEEELGILERFGLDNVYEGIEPLEPGRIIAGAFVGSDGVARFNHPDAEYAPWYLDPEDFEIVDD